MRGVKTRNDKPTGGTKLETGGWGSYKNLQEMLNEMDIILSKQVNWEMTVPSPRELKILG